MVIAAGRQLLAAMFCFYGLTAQSPAWAGPIHDSSKIGDAAQVEQLIGSGTDVDERDPTEKTALHWAADGGHLDVVQVLIASGANVNLKDWKDSTALFFASLGKNEAIVELLIAGGADVNVMDSDGMTALDGATMRKFSPSIIAMLKRAGARCGTNFHFSQWCKAEIGSE